MLDDDNYDDDDDDSGDDDFVLQLICSCFFSTCFQFVSSIFSLNLFNKN